ncbi:MAG: DUF4906 domain-containing protein [Candidatus Azobacteroides sp.]|nr:DUF4906 domain-containing protein [Candidatus Azobacteroides sp.]
MRKMIKSGQAFLLLLFVLFAVSSCTDDFTPAPKGPEGNNVGGEKEVLVNLSVPVQSLPSSQLRAISDTEENAIPNVTVLAFRAENGSEVFDYLCSYRAVDAQKGWATVKLKPYPQRFVVIANASNSPNNNYLGPWVNVDNLVGQAKDDMLSNLEFALTSGNTASNGGWKTTSSTDYTPIPMWGEVSAPLTVNSTTESFGETIQLLRMVAKIDVTLADSIQSKFKLTSVHLYKSYTKGRVVPKSSNISSTATGKEATKVSLPNDFYTSAGVLDLSKIYAPAYMKDSIRYTDVNADGNMRNVIYTFERDSVGLYSTGGTDPLNTTCLVIGGTLNGSTTPTYYRVDFVDSNKKHLDILRNHRYIVNITRVTGEGYGDPETAFESKAFNIEADILVWTDVDLEVAFDGQNFLAVSKNYFKFSKKTYGGGDTNNILHVRTDNSNGWYVESILDSVSKNPVTWVTVDPASSKDKPIKGDSAVLGSNVHFLLDANDTGGERVAMVTIVAGRLRYPVYIRQTMIEPVSVTFYKSRDSDFDYEDLGTTLVGANPDTLWFRQGIGTGRSQEGTQFLIATWTPANADAVLSIIRCHYTNVIYDPAFFNFQPEYAAIIPAGIPEDAGKVPGAVSGAAQWRLTPNIVTNDLAPVLYAVECCLTVSNGIEETTGYCHVIFEHTGPGR